MRRWKIEADDRRDVPVWFAAGVVAGIGTPRLAHGFLQTMQRVQPASHCTIFALEADGHASVVSAASACGDAAETAHELLRQRFDRQDSNMVWLGRRKTPRQSQAWMTHQSADEVADRDYRRRCYGDDSLRERASVLLLLDSGPRIAVSFYRNLACAPFGDADLAWIGRAAPLLMGAVVAHLRCDTAAAPEWRAPAHECLLARLPRREREVFSHVLAGRTTKEAAERLGLPTTTVLTYRYRAFARLGVRTQRELLALLDREPSDGAG